jgi:hypothetical protein
MIKVFKEDFQPVTIGQSFAFYSLALLWKNLKAPQEGFYGYRPRAVEKVCC